MTERKWHKVERFDDVDVVRGHLGCSGEYVNFEDYDSLAKTADALVEALEELVKARWMVSPDWCSFGEYDAVCDKAGAALKLARGEQDEMSKTGGCK